MLGTGEGGMHPEEPDWDLISEIGADLAAVAPSGWERLTITVAAFDEELIVSALAETPVGRNSFSLGNIAVDGLRLLRRKMYRLGRGTWYEAIVSVTPDHRVAVSFEHDDFPPNASRVPEELLVAMVLKDQDRYPRDQEHLPEWHPAKLKPEPLLVRYQLVEVEDRWLEEPMARALAEEGHTIRVFGSDNLSVAGKNTSGWVVTFGPGAYHVDFMDVHGNRTKHVIYIPRGDMLWRALVAEYSYPTQDRYWPDDKDLSGVHIGEADPATDFLRVITASGNSDPGVRRDYTGYHEQPFWQARPEFGDWMSLIEAARKASPAAGLEHFDQNDGDRPDNPEDGVVYSDAQTGQPLSEVAARSRFDAGQSLQINISPINEDVPGRVAILWAGPRDGATVIFHDEHGTEWRRHGYHGQDGRLWLATEMDSIYAGTHHNWERHEALYAINRGVVPGTGAEMVTFIQDPAEERVINTPPQFNFDGRVDTNRWVVIPTFGAWSAFTDPRGPRHTHASYALAHQAARLRAKRDAEATPSDTPTPGWTAIDNALEPLYPGVQPQHWGTVVHWSTGGPDPLDGMSAYPRSEPVPHWHYISYGMSDLYEKRSEDPDTSGWGFEFTFRLLRTPGETEAPIWPVNLLQGLGRYVFETGNIFGPGHHIDTNGPIASDEPICTPRALAFAEDPELGTIDTANGKVQFLQAVGLTIDEYEAAVSWNTTKLLELFADHIPLLVTDIRRETQLNDPLLRSTINAGIEQDGSSRSFLRVELVEWHLIDGLTLRFSQYVADEIARTLRARLTYGNTLLVSSPERSVLFKPADTYAIVHSADQVEIDLPVEALVDLAHALRNPGRTNVSTSMPGLAIETT